MTRTRTPLRPIALLLVVLLATGVGLLGTAGVSNAAAITKAQVKKIAKKQATKVVNTLAPTLSVASATNANTAAFATSANSANNANNANALGGVAASNYSKRIFARVNYNSANPSLIVGSPGVTVNGTESALGFAVVNFAQNMDNCAIVATTVSGAGTQIARRSSGFTGSSVQFALKDDEGVAIRVDFDVIAVC